jgi:hypothetical protein
VTDHAPYAVNLNPDGQHVLHTFPAHEECNLDDTAEKLVYLDEKPALQMVRAEKARQCEHCMPLAGVL